MAQSQSSFSLPALPFSENALEPIISSKTIGFHYGKHHKAYVDKLNLLVENTEYSGMPLEEIIKKTAGRADKAPLFNNAAQVWNHTFYWNCLKSKGGGTATGPIADQIKATFGSFESFKTTLIDTAVNQFGSGWAWVVLDGSSVKITSTSNAVNPLTQNQIPLLTIDVWEHAYYLDFQNKRKDHVQAVIESLINWESVNKAFAQAKR
ncbi:MAG: superoxide dismutase [Chitinivibrionales bacterium]|nr:superoxide dismutase [Chitinivibrionales bacterium]